jgi:glycerol-3-phosphate acyltransferase PlsY
MELTVTLKVILLVLVAYLSGAIPFGLVLTKCLTTVDIRKQGSGNIGATNVRRTAGNLLGALTLGGDLLKGALPVYLALCLLPEALPGREVCTALVALAAFCGHLYPIYLGFKDGGKGVATAAGCFLVLSPWAALVALLVFTLGLCWYNRVSVASLSAAAILPLAVWKATGTPATTVCAALIAVMIVYRHSDNIKRLLSGREPEL